jgi:sugar phosphate isomerase/epimerase
MRRNRTSTVIRTSPVTVDRRYFLKCTGAAALSAALDSRATPSRASSDRNAVGIQLYAMQAPLVQDFEGTLAALGHIGYREVEPVGLLGHDVKAFRKALDRAGLSAPSVHVVSNAAQALFLGMAKGELSPNEAWPKIHAAMDLKGIESIMEEMFGQTEVLGNGYLVMAATDSTLFASRAGVDRVIAAYTKAGDLCHQRGLKFAFHPHLAEFNRIDGATAMDRILDKTDPAKVFIELDFFWAAMANVDIPSLLDRYSGRFHLGHIKDMAKGVVVPADGYKDLDAIPGNAFEDVGHGQLDYRTWVPLARKAGMRHFFVERDDAPDPLENARRSYASLKPLLR